MFELFMAGTKLAAEEFSAWDGRISICWAYRISLHMGAGARSCQ
jgi:hypothetical protein